jgi:hypothetical protein
MLLPFPQGLPRWLISEAREIALFGFTVVPAEGAATWTANLHPFLTPIARRLAIYGWSTTD